MGALMRERDWASTPVGPVEKWPQSLRTALSILLASRYPMYVAWGPEFTQFYNDAYRPILGTDKHPTALGQGTPQCFAEIWDFIGPMFRRVMDGGEAAGLSDQLLPLERSGFLEECYFTFSYSAIRDESGRVGGVFVTCNEVTARVIGERRLQTLRDLASKMTGQPTEERVGEVAVDVLARSRHDLPFSLLYLTEDDDAARLVGSSGCAAEAGHVPHRLELADERPWPVAEVLRVPSGVLTRELAEGTVRLQAPVWTEPVAQAATVVIPRPGSARPGGMLVAGISPRLRFNAEYEQFLKLVASQIGEALAAARAKEEEHSRAEALAALDRAKTAFFSNVSHEFRTPMTLMLGPLEDLLQRDGAPLPPSLRDPIEMAYRNCRRLLRLVNSLLEFSRIEAGRIEASYEPTDLGAFTAELAGLFRSALERGGLELVVDCPPLNEAVFVDRAMWESIVLNLLSNAFKFTLHGRVTVSLRASRREATLTVQDTGTGIPEDEQPHLFERFHRAKGTRGRSFEGTGIGLALVQEMVRLHGGRVEVKSRPEVGSTFSVTLPLGSGHLARERVRAATDIGPQAHLADTFIEEALGWVSPPPGPDPTGILAEEVPSPPAGTALAPTRSRPRVLVADDNADVRDYLSRILGETYEVQTAVDGRAALECAQQRPPDLVLSDVMMPRLDGFGLLQELRRHEATRTLPIILLSARAGEESHLEGLGAGADDYLIKPFSARELLARVESQLRLAKLRREAELQQRALHDQVRAAAEALRRSHDELEVRVRERTSALAEANERLQREVQERRRSEETVSQLLRISHVLNSTLDLDALLDALVREAIALTGADSGCAGLRSEQGMVCHRYLQKGVVRALEYCFPPGHGLPGWLIQNRKPYLTNCAATDPQIVQALCGQFGVHNAISTPLMDRKGEVIGFFELHNKTDPAGFTQVDQERLLGVSQSAALAIQNALAYGKIAETEEALRKSEGRLRAMMDNSPAVIFLKDLEGRYIHVNRRFEAAFALPREAVLGRTDMEIFSKEQAEKFRANDLAVLQQDRPSQFEETARYGDGEHVSIVSKFPLHDAAGRAYALCGIAIDITERKQADASLRESEERLQFALDSNQIGAWDLDLETLEAERTLMHDRIFGYETPQPDWTYELFLSHVLPEDRAEVDRTFRKSVAERADWDFECRIRRHDGAVRWIWATGRHARDDHRRPGRILGLVQDITARKEAERALGDSEERLRLMVQNVKDYSIILLDPSGRVASWNAGAQRIKGYTAEEILGRGFSVFYNREDLARGLPDSLLSAALARNHCEHEGWQSRRDGTQFWANVVISPIRDETGQLRGFVKVTRDMTERRNAEEALRESNRALQSIFDAAPVAILGLDLEGRVASWSAGAVRMFGFTEAEALGQVCPTVPAELVEDFHEMVRRVARSGPEHLVRIRQTKGGKRIHASLHPAPLLNPDGSTRGIMVVLEDITARQQYEEGLRIVAETVVVESGEACLRALVRALSSLLEMDFAIIGELSDKGGERVRTVAFWGEGEFLPAIEYDLEHTPCDEVQRQGFCCFADGVCDRFPADTWLRERSVRSYVGITLRDPEGGMIGLISVMGRQPLQNPHLAEAMLQIFAVRAAGEMGRMRVQKALDDYSIRLQTLSRQLLAAQESERRRIANELHDQMGQSLTLLHIGLQSTRSLPEAAAVGDELNRHVETVVDLIQDVRTLSLDLRPSLLDDLGLIPALRWHADRVAQPGQLTVAFRTDMADDERLLSEIETACFRVAQEALTNVLRHANARRVEISLSGEPGFVLLTVRDDGCGFDPKEAARRTGQGASLGLLSMEERSRLAGGHMTLESAPGTGTVVRARFPRTLRSANLPPR